MARDNQVVPCPLAHLAQAARQDAASSANARARACQVRSIEVPQVHHVSRTGGDEVCGGTNRDGTHGTTVSAQLANKLALRQIPHCKEGLKRGEISSYILAIGLC